MSNEENIFGGTCIPNSDFHSQLGAIYEAYEKGEKSVEDTNKLILLTLCSFDHRDLKQLSSVYTSYKVSLETKVALPRVDDPILNTLKDSIRTHGSNSKIKYIKDIRAYTGWGLKQSKEYVEEKMDEFGWQ